MGRGGKGVTPDPSLPDSEVSESPQYKVCCEHIIPHLYYLHESWSHSIIPEVILFRKGGGRNDIAVKGTDSRARFPRLELWYIHQS